MEVVSERAALSAESEDIVRLFDRRNADGTPQVEGGNISNGPKSESTILGDIIKCKGFTTSSSWLT